MVCFRVLLMTSAQNLVATAVRRATVRPSPPLTAHLPSVTRYPPLPPPPPPPSALGVYHEGGLRGDVPVRRYPAFGVVRQLLPGRDGGGDIGLHLRQSRRQPRRLGRQACF